MSNKSVELHINSKVIVAKVINGRGGSVTGMRLLAKIKQLLQMDSGVKIYRSYHKCNYCADALANIGCGQGFMVIFYEQVAQMSLL